MTLTLGHFRVPNGYRQYPLSNLGGRVVARASSASFDLLSLDLQVAGGLRMCDSVGDVKCHSDSCEKGETSVCIETVHRLHRLLHGGSGRMIRYRIRGRIKYFPRYASLMGLYMLGKLTRVVRGFLDE